MRKAIVAICLLFPLIAFAQKSRPKDVTRFLFWITPTGRNNVTIDGVAVGPMSLPTTRGGKLRINGANLEVVPVAFFTIIGSMFTTFINAFGDDYYAEPYDINTEIHGISISGGLFEKVKMNGLSLNMNSYAGTSNGIEFSCWGNSNYSYSGLQLSAYGNRAVEGRGVQIGSFNSCQDCTGIQIGFINRMGRRVLPLINFSFRKRGRGLARRSKMIEQSHFNVAAIPSL
jgi:hypothetical protein